MESRPDLPIQLSFQLDLMEKQISRISALGKFLPFQEQQEELSLIVQNLEKEIAYLKFHPELFLES